MSVQTRRKGIVALLAIAALVGAAVLFSSRASERMATERAACLSCHDDVDGHVADHEDVSCQGCHEVSEYVPLRLVLSDLFADEDPVEHGAVAGATCRSCHEADSTRWRRQMQTAGHRAHIGEGVACTSCHGGAMHGGPFEPGCVGCHDDVPVHGEVGEGDCITCHGFSADEDATDEDGAHTALLPDALLEIAPWTAHFGAGVERVHGAGECRTCHNPHQSAEAEADCVTCHRGVLAADVAQGNPGHRECDSCHTPHPPRDEPATTCLNCHRPPPPGARRRASGESIWVQSLHDDPDAGIDASGLTHEGRCGTCHTPHVFEASPDGCPECHEDQQEHVAVVDGHDACLGCHEPHSPPPGAESCRGCHRDVGHGGAPAAHQSCLSCHEAHDGAPGLQATCARCHGEVTGALRAGPESHQSCESCHTPHGDPSRGSTSACADCHRDQHRAASATVNPVAHRQCASCHSAHEFTDAPRCAGCHAEQARASATWPSGSIHAGPCAGCHQSHEVGRIPSCRSCHAEQTSRSHTGRHQACTTCHEVHAPFPSAGTGWWSTCASCHEEQTRATRGAPGAHAACSNCHDPIGQRPPRCTSCHETITQTLQHQAHRRQACADCHTGHSVAPPGRATCVGCHEDMARTHFPDAGTCQSCHPFAR